MVRFIQQTHTIDSFITAYYFGSSTGLARTATKTTKKNTRTTKKRKNSTSRSVSGFAWPLLLRRFVRGQTPDPRGDEILTRNVTMVTLGTNPKILRARA